VVLFENIISLFLSNDQQLIIDVFEK